jgi:hypothetical protein
MSNQILEKFVVQMEWTESWDELSNEEMGILFRNFIKYTKGLEIDRSNRTVNVAWDSVKKQIDRMTEKYLKDVETGKRGGAPKGNKNASKQPKNNPQTTEEQPLNNPETTYKYKYNYNYKDNYKEKDKENDLVIDKELNKEVIGKNFDEKIYYEKNKATIHFLMDNYQLDLDAAIELQIQNEEVEKVISKIFN